MLGAPRVRIIAPMRYLGNALDPAMAGLLEP